jgi:hypothetical protein
MLVCLATASSNTSGKSKHSIIDNCPTRVDRFQ